MLFLMFDKLWVKITAIIIGIVILIIIAFMISTDSVNPEALVTFQAEQEVSFKCEVADTTSERSQGLMDRETLAQDAGMLFVFENPQNVTFWMKNTLIPLDIVFIDESGKVVNIAQANPEPGVADSDLTRYSSDRPVKWVLEVNQGLCANNLIMPGTQISIEF